jgi:hypothetical protein
MEQQNSVSEGAAKQTWSSVEDLGNGIFVYRDVLTKDLDIINRLEASIGQSNPATLSGNQRMLAIWKECQTIEIVLILNLKKPISSGIKVLKA